MLSLDVNNLQAIIVAVEHLIELEILFKATLSRH